MIGAPSEFHFEWGNSFDRLYKLLAADILNCNHIFRDKSNNSGQLTTESVKNTDAQIQNLNMVKCNTAVGEKAARIRVCVMVRRKYSLHQKPIKQVKSVEECCDLTCPKQPSYVLN